MDKTKEDELEDILKKASDWHKQRNQFVHSRWAIPDGKSGVTNIKFKGIGDTAEEVTPNDLRKIADGMERCTEQLRSFFLKIGDYQNWLIKRMPE